MKITNFSKNSWHFRLASLTGFKVNPYKTGVQYDGCKYINRVILGFVLLVSIIAVTCTVAYSLGYGVVVIVHRITDGVWLKLTPTVVVGLAFVIAIVGTGVFGAMFVGIICCLFYVVKLFERGNQYLRSSGQPSFVKLWYQSTKDKMCFLISFDDVEPS